MSLLQRLVPSYPSASPSPPGRPPLSFFSFLGAPSHLGRPPLSFFPSPSLVLTVGTDASSRNNEHQRGNAGPMAALRVEI
jgi:hypothetical protein